jgi:hypothetical protein
MLSALTQIVEQLQDRLGGGGPTRPALRR